MLRDRLEALVGKHIGTLCDNGFADPAQNHCAHFVAHALGIDHPFTCRQHRGGRARGANIRVHELFALCPRVGRAERMDRDRVQLVFVTLAANVDLARRTMVNIPRKHVGIWCGDVVYHYGNTADRVVKEPFAAFEARFRKAYGPGQGFFYGFLPGEGTGVTVAMAGKGVSAQIGFALEAPDDAWFATPAAGQRFLVGRETSHGGRRGLLRMPADGPRYRAADHAARLGHWATLLEVIGHCESRNRFGALNTYDRARFTFGFVQFAAHTPGDNLVLLMRMLVASGVARPWFPELAIVGGRLHRIDRDGGRTDLEAETASGPGRAGELSRFMDYLNPDGRAVDPQEVLHAARLVHMAEVEPRARTTQVDCAYRMLEQRMARYQQWYGLHGRSDTLCAIVADIHHQGRAGRAAVKAALADGDPVAALLAVSPRHAPRSVELASVVARLEREGRLGRKRYDAAANLFS